MWGPYRLVHTLLWVPIGVLRVFLLLLVLCHRPQRSYLLRVVPVYFSSDAFFYASLGRYHLATWPSLPRHLVRSRGAGWVPRTRAIQCGRVLSKYRPLDTAA